MKSIEDNTRNNVEINVNNNVNNNVRNNVEINVNNKSFTSKQLDEAYSNLKQLDFILK